MNYIKQLETENKELKQNIAEIQEMIQEFRTHLLLPKFYEDTTIQIGDVEMRLMEILSKSTEVV